MTLTFGSLFAGIEGFGLGLERAGFKCVWQVEKNESCKSVLAKHFPDVPRFDDVNEFSAATIPVRPSLICGGFPCQDLSVAGKRAGLAGERSGLFHQFMRIVGEFTPGTVLIENVAGLLSSNGGNDMEVVLRSLAERGYGFAYRVLDAQWFGVAQRRRRVFIVGCLGDWRRAAEILFERESLPWDSAPSRAQGARTAASLTAGSATGSGVNRPGRRREDDVNLALCLDAKNGKRYDGESETFVATDYKMGKFESSDVARGLTLSPDRTRSAPIVAHSLRAEGHDASEDGTGRGTPLVFDERSVTSPHNRSACRPGDAVPTMHSSPLSVAYAIQERAVAENLKCGPQSKGWQEEKAYCLESRHTPQTVAGFKRGQCAKARSDSYQLEQSPTLTSTDSGTQQSPGVQIGSTVRRLTPRECERLQGFPDDWTEGHSDSARYRMLGNAVAVPVATWIGRRILESVRS